MKSSPWYRWVFLVLFAVCCVAVRINETSAEEITNTLGMKFRLLDAGRFEMGERDLSAGFHKDHTSFNSQDDRPRHPVVLTKPFYLATTEVTVGQFRRFIQDTGYQTSAEKNELGAVGWDPKPPADNPRYVSTFRDGDEFNWKQPGFAQQEDHPVVGVSFADAKAFCQWLSRKEDVQYRLPSEAEWEYAARAGSTTYFSFGNVYRRTIHQHANIGNVELEKAFPDRVRRQWLVDVENDPADQHVFTAPVGSYQANPWGLFDLYGNVWEWCEDRFLDTAYAPYTRPGHQQVRKRAIDPLVLKKSNDVGDWRVIRGGSWFNAPIQCRSGVRGYFEANDAACYIGFRLARSASPEIVAATKEQFEQSEAARESITRIIGDNNVRERRDGRLTLLLQRDHLTDDLFAALKTLDEPVDLHLYGRGQLSGDKIEPLLKTRILTGLLITEAGDKVVDSDFARLSTHPELEQLQITGAPKLTNQLFEYLSQHNRLELLHLNMAGVTDAGVSQLPPLQELKELRLQGTSCEGAVLERFQQSPLKKFSCSKLTDESAQSLKHFRELQSLELAGSPIGPATLNVVSGLPWVTELGLSDCAKLKDADFAVLGHLYELQHLQLERTEAGDRAAIGLSRLNNLRGLHMGSENLTNEGMQKLSEIVSLHHLTIAKEGTKLTDAGFSDSWRLINLRGLSIHAPQVTGEGFGPIAELSLLERVNLSGEAISDAALTRLAKSNSISRIFVGDWQRGGPSGLSDRGILSLVQARRLTQFEFLRRNTQITDEGLNQLREKRPELNVRER